MRAERIAAGIISAALTLLALSTTASADSPACKPYQVELDEMGDVAPKLVALRDKVSRGGFCPDLLARINLKLKKTKPETNETPIKLGAASSPDTVPAAGTPSATASSPVGAAPPKKTVAKLDTQPSKLANPQRSASSDSEIRLDDATKDCPNCPEMSVIPPGEFVMGSPTTEPGRFGHEGPQHRVRISYSFALGKYDVTWDEWEKCVLASACRRNYDDGSGKGRRPVTNVTWNDAQDYIKWLNSQVSGSPYRLPSEAEWEYAARAGNPSAYYWGETFDASQASMSGLTTALIGTTPVGQYKANAFGLYDMAGNVWQWVEDCYAESYTAGQPDDGSAFQKDNCSVGTFRGGSWTGGPQFLRSASRGRAVRDQQINARGFRVAKTLVSGASMTTANPTKR